MKQLTVLTLGIIASLSVVSCSGGDGDSIVDCNQNGVADSLDITSGAPDCNLNGLLDQCELADGSLEDNFTLTATGAVCAADGIPDTCQIVPAALDRYGVSAAGSVSCLGDNVPDQCQPVPDCDADGIPNVCEIASGAADRYGKTGNTITCLADGIPDSCQSAADCDADGIPNFCEIAAGAADRYGALAGSVTSCVADGIPDSCQTVADCDTDGIPNQCEIQSGAADRYGVGAGGAITCVADTVPDSCQPVPDCDTDGIPNFCEIQAGAADAYGATAGAVTGCTADGIPDSCQPVADCDTDGTPNSCEIAAGAADAYGVGAGGTVTCVADTVPDSCQPVADCDADGTPDVCELLAGATDCDDNDLQDSCQIAANPGLDLDANAELDECQDPATVVFALTDAPSDEFFSLIFIADALQLVKPDGTLTADLITAPVRLDLIGSSELPILLKSSEIPFGTYRGVRLTFSGAPTGRLNNGTASPTVSIAGGGTSIVLEARFEAPVVVAEGTTSRFLVDFDLEWSLVPTGTPIASYTLTPIGETRVVTGGLAIEDIRGEVIAVDSAASKFTLRAFIDDDCTSPAGEIVVDLSGGAPAPLLYTSTGATFTSTAAFLGSLQAATAPGLGTVLEVHGSIDAVGALRATRVNVENGLLPPVGGGTLVELDGIVTAAPNSPTAGFFTMALAEAEQGRAAFLAVVGALPATFSPNFDAVTRFVDASGASIPNSDLVPGTRVKVKYTEFNVAPAVNQASVVELTNPIIDFEGVLNNISGLGGTPPIFTMRLDADEWAIAAGQVTNSTTNVTVDLTNVAPPADTTALFLKVVGSPAISLGNIPIDTVAPLDSNGKLDVRGVRSGPASTPSIAATQVRLYPGRVRAAAVIDFAPQPNGDLLLKLTTPQVIDPFGQSYVDNQTRVVLRSNGVILGNKTSLSTNISIPQLIGLGNDPTCDMEVIAKGLASTDPQFNNNRLDIYELRIRCR